MGLVDRRVVIVQEPAYGEAVLQTSASRKGVTYIINDMGWYRSGLSIRRIIEIVAAADEE